MSMKKLLVFLFCIIFLTACGFEVEKNEEEGKEAIDTDTKDSEPNQNDDKEAVEVDKNLLSVEVTIPSSMIESTDESIAKAEEEGLKVTENEDGSLTYKMSKSKHKEMMNEIKKQLDQSMEEIKTSGDFPSIQDITSNEDFSEFHLSVDREGYENSMDGFAVLGIGITGMMYQLYDGASPDDYDVTINVKDSKSDEVFDTIHYPEDMQTME
ncbi:hypothetical protein DLJ74_04525 [Gracilibacillus dipsosauri]|uniref:Antigen I/II N-terminal domain-containing protein n=2 Tax=Gracilibacillus dipsosauri TaxID=178340 RepID=A0A317L1B1_9BACI|nr:hypothetical protein DLJ74_04525 [Gracilibacillus dipsosauri]